MEFILLMRNFFNFCLANFFSLLHEWWNGSCWSGDCSYGLSLCGELVLLFSWPSLFKTFALNSLISGD